MEFEFIRDYAMYAAIFGLLSFIWFIWAQERPRQAWRKYLWIGSGLALVVSLVGIFLSVTNWDAATSLRDAGVLSMYLTVFFTLLVIGVIVSIILSRNNKRDLIAPWVTFLVGVQFNWLVRVFNDFGLYLLGFLIVAVALLAPHFARRWNVASSAVTGIGAGAVMLLFAVFGLVRFFLA